MTGEYRKGLVEILAFFPVFILAPVKHLVFKILKIIKLDWG